MTLDQIDPGADSDPVETGATEAAAPDVQEPEPAAPAQPVARFTDADMARARKSFENDARRRQEAAIEAAVAAVRAERAEYEQRPQPQAADPNDPYSQIDPAVAGAIRAAMQAEIESRLAPFRQREADLTFRGEEAALKAKHPDYDGRTRLDVLEFAVRNQIPRLDAAYAAWKFGQMPSREQIEREGVTSYLKRKIKQATTTPTVEKGGGGAPSSKQSFKSREDMDAAAEDMIRAANRD